MKPITTYILLCVYCVAQTSLVVWNYNKRNDDLKVDKLILDNNKTLQVHSYMSGWAAGYLKGREEPDTLFYVKDMLKLMKTDSIDFVTKHIKP